MWWPFPKEGPYKAYVNYINITHFRVSLTNFIIISCFSLFPGVTFQKQFSRLYLLSFLKSITIFITHFNCQIKVIRLQNIFFTIAKKYQYSYVLKINFSPGWCGSVDWVPASLQTKGLLSDSQSRAHAWVAGEVPPVGVWKRKPHIDDSLPLFLSLPSST